MWRAAFVWACVHLVLLPHPAAPLLLPCHRSNLNLLSPVRTRKGNGRRALLLIRACASEEPDADLASAWLDEEEAGILQGSSVPEIEPAEASERALRKASWLLDLRTARQHERSHASGAISIPAGQPGKLGLLFHFREDFEEDVLDRFGEGTPSLVLICELGVVSRVAANKLIEAGLNADIAIVRGGFEAYSLEPALPVEMSPTYEQDLAQEVEDYYNEDFVRTMWSFWEEDEGEMPLQPVLSMQASADSPEAKADELEQEEDEEGEEVRMRAGKSSVESDSGDAAEIAAGGEDGGSMLNLRELEHLLGEAPSAPGPASSGSAPRAGAGDRSAAPSSLGPPTGDYYSSPLSGYGVSSRSSRGGFKQRRTRGGLPPAWLVDISHLDFPLLSSTGSLETLSVKELKSWLYHHDGSLSGPKRELVERVEGLLPQQTDEASAKAAQPPPPANGQAAHGAPPIEMSEMPAAAVGAGLQSTGGDPSLEASLDGEPKDDFLIDEVFSAM